MERLTTALRLLALAVALAGLVCLYLVYRPADPAAAWRAAGYLAPLANTWVIGSALVALAAGVGARLAEHVRPLEPPESGVHRLEAPIEFAGDAPAPVVVRRAGSVEGLGGHLRRRRLGFRRPDVPAFVDELLAAAVGAGASDVHLQPGEAGTRVVWRVRGELAEVVAAPREHHETIVRRIKILAGLVTYQSDLPQDGRFTLETEAGRVDVRTSVLPTRHGEKVVLRLARAGGGLIELDRLGMPDAVLESFTELLAAPQGLIVLTGPTGCGKTTTLYASLAHVHRTRGGVTSIATIEDPVEIDLPFLAQAQVDREAGFTFEAALRSTLRQDPNVLMIGEIRDRETAAIAVEAGLTGHLILTTLHAESAAGAFNRLIELGVEPFLVSSAVLAVVSQRLARRLCPRCRRPAAASRPAQKRLVQRGITRTAAESLSYYAAPGCEACGGTGLAGRTAVFELLRVTPALRERIAAGVPTDQIARAALEEGITPLLKAAVLEAVAGTLSLEEALRVAA